MEDTEKIHENALKAERLTAPIVSFLHRYGRIWMSFVLFLSDTGSILLAGLAAVILRNIFGNDLNPALYLHLIPVALFFPFVFSLRGLYPGHGLGPVEELRRLTINTTLVFVIMTAFTFFTQAPPIYSRLTLGLAWLLALGFIPVSRKLVRNFCVHLHVWEEPVVILGPRNGAHKLSALLAKSPNAGFLPVMLCDLNGCPLNSAGENSDRCEDCQVNKARIAFVVHSELSQLENIREKFRSSFEHVVLVTSHDNGLNLSRVEVRDFTYFKGLEVHQTLLDRTAQVQKRAVDLLVSSIGLLVLSPLLLILSWMILLDSPGKLFYRQRRVGKGGKTFGLLKFRSMHTNADQILESVLANDPVRKLEWEQYQKLRQDPRITRVGALLRRFSLDELPQLFNIIKGEMSLVGPRPIMLNQKEIYGGCQKFYTRVIPGLTGLWQISGRNTTSFSRRVELDVQYVKDWSLWLDIYILIRTVWVVLNREGAS